MMELGKYAAAVIGSYAISIALIAALVALSIWKSARVKRALADVEARASVEARAGKDVSEKNNG